MTQRSTSVGRWWGEAGDRQGTGGRGRYLQGCETLQKRHHPVVFFVQVGLSIVSWLTLVLGHVL